MANNKTHHSLGDRLRVYKKRFSKLSKAAKLQIAAIVGIVILIIIVAFIALSGKGKNPSDIVNNEDSFDISASYDPAADKKYVDEYAEAVKEFKEAILPVNQENDAKYFRETVFVGDSNTEGLATYGHLSLQYVCGMTGMAIQSVTSNECMWFVGYDSPVTMPTAVGMLKPRRVIVNFGTNNVGGTTTSDFISSYKNALKAINKAYPYADIIVSAVLPVAKNRSYPNMTMQDIDEFNLALAEMCKDEGYKFLNTAEEFKDPANGFMKKDYAASDGIHLSSDGFKALLEYVSNHKYITKDQRPARGTIPTRKNAPYVSSDSTNYISSMISASSSRVHSSSRASSSSWNSSSRISSSLGVSSSHGNSSSVIHSSSVGNSNTTSSSSQQVTNPSPSPSSTPAATPEPTPVKTPEPVTPAPTPDPTTPEPTTPAPPTDSPTEDPVAQASPTTGGEPAA